MNLVIVESAAKAKTISKYLNEIPELKHLGRFKVIASFGHINDLPRKELGIDKSKWTGTYLPLDAKKKVIANIKKDAKNAKMIYIASDLDMEGEAIANHIRDTLELGEKDYKRITFNEITKTALRDAVLHPRHIDMKMVNAQEARRFLDRVVGYELSPLLWRRFATSRLSAGRVQSVALKMIVDKEREGREHNAEQLWMIHGDFETGKTTLSAKTNATWESEKDIAKVTKFLVKKGHKWIAHFSKRESKRNPSAPFVTSSLQQEAYNRLGLPAKRTMQIAQSLYEAGHITYMRTDSPNLSEQAKSAIIEYITDKFGKDHVQTRVFKTRASNAQEAHECVRPTKIDVRSSDLSDVEGIHKKLYDLIWRRTVASQMIPATFLDLSFTIKSDSFEEEFKGSHDVLIHEGYLKVYSPDQKPVSQAEIDKWDERSDIEVRPVAFVAKGDVSRPPPLYNEPALVKALEKEGIGRPSTYAAIVDKLFSKGYVIKGTNPNTKTVHVNSYKWHKGAPDITKEEETIVIGGSESDKFVSTSLGERVVDYITQTVPFIVQKKFTADMEKELDLICDGDKKKQEVLNDFYKVFQPAIAKAQSAKAAKKPHEKVCKVLSPSDKMVLREFTRANVKAVQTRYGPALLKEPEGKWVSLMPFLKWRKKTIEELTENDVRFLYSFPVPVASTEGCRYEVHMGRYGLYIKDDKGNNTRLPKEKWDDVYSSKFVLSKCDISSFEKKQQRPRAASSPRK